MRACAGARIQVQRAHRCPTHIYVQRRVYFCTIENVHLYQRIDVHSADGKVERASIYNTAQDTTTGAKSVVDVYDVEATDVDAK